MTVEQPGDIYLKYNIVKPQPCHVAKRKETFPYSLKENL